MRAQVQKLQTLPTLQEGRLRALPSLPQPTVETALQVLHMRFQTWQLMQEKLTIFALVAEDKINVSVFAHKSKDHPAMLPLSSLACGETLAFLQVTAALAVHLLVIVANEFNLIA